jgi:WD40 repeat protein
MATTRCLCVALLLAPALRAEEKPPALWEEKEAIWAVAFSSDGRLLATGSWNDSISVWETSTLVRKQRLTSTGQVLKIVFAPDGKSLVVSGFRDKDDPYLTVIPLAGGKRRDLDIRIAQVRAIALSPDGSRLAVTGDAGAVNLLDLGSGKRVWKGKADEGDVWGVAFSPDGRTLATADGKERSVTLWEVASGKERLRLTGHHWGVASVAFAPDGRTLLSGSGDLHPDKKPGRVGELFVWDLVTGKRTRKLLGQKGLVRGLGFSSDGKTLASTNEAWDYHAVKVWDWPASTERQTLEGPVAVQELLFSADGRWLLALGNDRDPYHSFSGVKLWDAKTLRQKLSPPLEAERDRREKILREQEQRQKLARAARDNRQRDGYWKREAERRADRLRRAEYALAIRQAAEAIRSEQFEEARKLLDGLKPGPGETDLRSFEWHYLRGRLPREIVLREFDDENEIQASAVTPDGSTVALAEVVPRKHLASQVSLIDGKTGQTRTTFKGFNAIIRRLALSRDGRLLAVSEEAADAKPARLTLWNVETSRLMAELPHHHSWPTDLTFSDSGKFLAEACDGTVRVWDVRSRKFVHVLGKHEDGAYNLVFSPDDKTLAVGVPDTGYVLYDLNTGKEKARLEQDGLSHNERATFSPDGRHLFTPGERETLWDVAGGKRVHYVNVPLLRRLLMPNRDDWYVRSDEKAIRLVRVPRTQYWSALRMNKPLEGVGFSDDGRDLLAEDCLRQIYRWDVATGDARRVEPVGEAQAEFDFDGKAGKVRVGKNTLSLRELARLSRDVKGEKAHWAALHAVSSDGRLILIGEAGTLVLRDALTGKVRIALPFINGDQRKGLAVFSADARRLFTFFVDRTNRATDVITWDTNTGKEVGRIVAPGEIEALRLDRAGQAPTGLLIDKPDQTGFRHWDVETGVYTFDLQGQYVAASPDGKLFATCEAEVGVRLHDAATGHLRLVLRDLHWPSHLAFHPSGKALAVGDTVERAIALYRTLDWSTASGEK